MVLARYLFDFGRICTQDLGGFRENHDRFTALDASVLGLTFEGDRVHTAFAASIHLPFPLLIDFYREAVGWSGIAYTPGEPFSGFWGMGRRSVFVLDRQGVTRYA